MKIIWWSVLFCNTIALLISLTMLFAGSQELFPSKEQQASARLVWGIFVGSLVFTEIMLIRKLL